VIVLSLSFLCSIDRGTIAPSKSARAVARSGGTRRLRGRRKRALPRTAVSTMAGFRLLRAATCTCAVAIAVLPFDTLADVKSVVPVAHSPTASRVESFAAFIAEASRRFAIPERWIRGVMQLESGANLASNLAKGSARADASHAQDLG
jgi:hypothetical protein